jgi:hypothetical protein
MARHLAISGRNYWVLSEPLDPGWKAYVVEVQADGTSDQIGVEATAVTRRAADDAAERKLRRLVDPARALR